MMLQLFQVKKEGFSFSLKIYFFQTLEILSKRKEEFLLQAKFEIKYFMMKNFF